MKVGDNYPETLLKKRDRFKIYICICLFWLPFLVTQTDAQCALNKKVFHAGEQISYDIYFKWGLLMPKAGQANFVIKRTPYEQHNSWNYNLIFRTNGIFEKIYKMRDTLECFFTPNHQLLFSSKRTTEGGRYMVENITFTNKGNKTQSHTHRYNLESTRIDTTIITDGCVYDMMAGVMFLRTIDWSNIQRGQEFATKVAIGRDIVNMSFRYVGQAIVERNENLKYRTRHFYIDIYDDAFTQSKEAAEVWIGDDDNHLPVKIKAKLKIGAAEVYYNSSSNLQYPLTSRIEIPKR
ncbi:MAG: DUF3108 domain-containing protein [Tannerellaceae bacterium]|nr:DUF3108 domain-containing protein [Tannerellaceae bacterium]